MRYILIGSMAFVFFFFFDIYTLKNEGIKKKMCGIMGLVLFIYSVGMVKVRQNSNTLIRMNPNKQSMDNLIRSSINRKVIDDLNNNVKVFLR